jgi:hypothetical protein
MDSANWRTYNELLREIKFVIDNKFFGLKVQPKLDNNLRCNIQIFCDRDFALDPYECNGFYYLVVGHIDLSLKGSDPIK